MPPCLDAALNARATSASTTSIDSPLRGLTATHDLPDMYGVSSAPISASVPAEQQYATGPDARIAKPAIHSMSRTTMGKPE